MGAGASRQAAVAMLMDKQATVAKLTFEEIDTDKNGGHRGHEQAELHNYVQ